MRRFSASAILLGSHEMSRPTEPYELPYGLKATAKLLTTTGMAAVQAVPRRTVETTERQARERTGTGAFGMASLIRNHTPPTARFPPFRSTCVHVGSGPLGT